MARQARSADSSGIAVFRFFFSRSRSFVCIFVYAKQPPERVPQKIRNDNYDEHVLVMELWEGRSGLGRSLDVAVLFVSACVGLHMRTIGCCTLSGMSEVLCVFAFISPHF